MMQAATMEEKQTYVERFAEAERKRQEAWRNRLCAAAAVFACALYVGVSML